MALACWGIGCDRNAAKECPHCKLRLCADCFRRDTQHESGCVTGERMLDAELAAEEARLARDFAEFDPGARRSRRV